MWRQSAVDWGQTVQRRSDAAFRTLFPVFTKRQSNHQCCQCFYYKGDNICDYCLLSCTPHPFWKGVYSKMKEFALKEVPVKIYCIRFIQQNNEEVKQQIIYLLIRSRLILTVIILVVLVSALIGAVFVFAFNWIKYTIIRREKISILKRTEKSQGGLRSHTILSRLSFFFCTIKLKRTSKIQARLRMRAAHAQSGRNLCYS